VTSPATRETLSWQAHIGITRLHGGGALPDPAVSKESEALRASLTTQRGHLALDIERFWFRAVIAGEQVSLESGAGAWQVPADVPAGAVFEEYRQEIACANAIIAATPLDRAPAWWPDGLFGSWRLDDLREIMLHVITETACHAGLLDAVRELIDGRTWMVLT